MNMNDTLRVALLALLWFMFYLLRMEQSPVSSQSDLINDSWL